MVVAWTIDCSFRPDLIGRHVENAFNTMLRFLERGEWNMTNEKTLSPLFTFSSAYSSRGFLPQRQCLALDPVEPV